MVNGVQSWQASNFAGMRDYYVQAGECHSMESVTLNILQKQRSTVEALHRISATQIIEINKNSKDCTANSCSGPQH